jgi:hypothetical protein
MALKVMPAGPPEKKKGTFTVCPWIALTVDMDTGGAIVVVWSTVSTTEGGVTEPAKPVVVSETLRLME